MRHLLKVSFLLALAAMLSLATLGSVLADAPAAQPELHVRGAISAINASGTPPTVTITPKEGAPVSVKIVASTKITKSGLGKATLGELAVGDRANATYNKDSLEASRLEVSQPVAKHHGFAGTIKEKLTLSGYTVGSTAFTLTTRHQGIVTIFVNSETKYQVPGVKNATLDNFKAGDEVAVLAADVNGTWVALHVHLIPAKPVHVHRVGTVTDYQPGKSITLKDKKGETSTFVVTSETKIKFKRGATGVKVGDRVMVSARRDPSTDKFTAKEILDFGTEKGNSQKP